MPSLRDLQTAFASGLRSGDASAIAPFIVANGCEPPLRLGIYANNVRENTLGTLEAAFPVLVRLAGHEWFRQTAAAYLRWHPSRHGDLHHLGERFAAWLEAELADGPYLYFADVARLEWAYQEVLVAADAAPLALTRLAAVPADRYEQLVFALQPAARLVGSPWPLLAIWRANQPGAEDEGTIDLDAGASRLLVIRRSSHVELRELPRGEFALLTAIASAATLSTATSAALADDPDFELTDALLAAQRLGVLSDFHLRSQ
jgi:hypothetical protein